MKASLRYLTQAALLILPVSLVLAQQPTAQERVVALKASLAASQAILKQYEWVETTVVSLKGEEKSRQMNRCYHGAAGRVTLQPLPGQRVRLTFADYLKGGDSLALEVDLASNRPLEAKVTTYLEDSKDQPVILDVKFSTLPNVNATYASTLALDAQGKKLAVNVENSGYRRAGN